MSTLSVSNITNGTDTVETGYVLNGSAKAWTNAKQDGTQAIRSSLNFSSITDEANGISTVTYTSAFANTDYCTTSGIRDGGGENDTRMVNGSTTAGYYTATSQRVYCGAHSATASAITLNDAEVLCLCLNGDLA